MTNPRDALAWATAIVAGEMAGRAYGQVTFILEAGRIVHVKVEQSHRPPVEEKPQVTRVFARG